MSLTGCYKTKEPNPLRESLLGTWEGGLNNPFQPLERFTIRLDVRDNDSIVMSRYGCPSVLAHHTLNDSTLTIEGREYMGFLYLTDSTLRLHPYINDMAIAMMYAVEYQRIR